MVGRRLLYSQNVTKCEKINDKTDRHLTDRRTDGRKRIHERQLMQLFTWISFLVGHNKRGQHLVQAGIQIPIQEKPEN